MLPPTGSSSERSPQPGDIALGLLADEWKVALIAELEPGPLRPRELERALVGISHGPLIERLKELVAREIAFRESVAESPPHVEYSLTDRGRALVAVIHEAAKVEIHTPSSGARRAGVPTLRLVSDWRNRAIGRTLAHGPLSAAELERKLPRIGHASLGRSLGELAHAGVVRSERETSGRTPYALTEYGRRLARVVLWAARWERRWLAPDAQPTTDLGGLLHVITPDARLPRRYAGVCRLRIEATPREPDIYLSVANGRIEALILPPPMRADAQGSGGALAWGDALLDGDLGSLDIEGDVELMTTTVAALGAALRI